VLRQPIRDERALLLPDLLEYYQSERLTESVKARSWRDVLPPPLGSRATPSTGPSRTVTLSPWQSLRSSPTALCRQIRAERDRTSARGPSGEIAR
jgi:hypothetical protein